MFHNEIIGQNKKTPQTLAVSHFLFGRGWESRTPISGFGDLFSAFGI